jgi:murein L,D-transpeptidase YafK
MRLSGDVEVAPRLNGRASLIATVFVLMITMSSLCGCSMPLDDIDAIRIGAVRPSTLEKMASLNVDRAAPVLLRVYKEESTFEVWKEDRSGKYILLNTYPICKFSGKLGPKISEGDRQTPEGFYEITPEQMFPLSREYLAFNIGFPNAFDRSLGRSGSFIMVHGGCASIGCYAMTHQQMDEIYRLIDEAFDGGQNRVPFEAFPFRMTAENLARHAPNNPHASFWAMLKAGSDSFLERQATRNRRLRSPLRVQSARRPTKILIRALPARRTSRLPLLLRTHSGQNQPSPSRPPPTSRRLNGKKLSCGSASQGPARYTGRRAHDASRSSRPATSPTTSMSSRW